MAGTQITIEAQLLEQVRETASQDGTSPDLFVEDAIRRQLARRFWQQNQVEAAQRRGQMTDEEVDDIVSRAIAEYRHESRK